MRHFSRYLAAVIILSFGTVFYGAVPASAQVGSPPATAGGQFPATGPEAAFEALHQGRNAEALRLFIDILSLNPGNSDALVGAGLAALRAGDLEGALFYLGKASTLYPSYSDALYGLALAKERTGDIDGARKAIAAAVKLDPTREDIAAAAGRLFPAPVAELPAYVKPDLRQMNFRIGPARTYQVFEKGALRDFFWKGVNLGAALPGEFPSQFPEKSVYSKWLSEIGECGFNLIRVYTIHPPVFYEALREYNLSHAFPIYLVHGVWAELPPEDDFLDEIWLGEWKTEMRAIIDIIHGRANLAARPGHSSGNYRADVSGWTAGIILGREWEPGNVELFNSRHSELQGFEGDFVVCRSDNPMESFLALAMDYFLTYENDTYNAQRPIAFTNWPTLDPLHFVSESTGSEELALRKKLGMQYGEGGNGKILEYDNDSMTLDMQNYDAGYKNAAGLFASYHAYPYYPDFLNLDDSLKTGTDAWGPNNYKAYLDLLVAHHTKHPVVISEFGVPSSRLVAHWQPQGITHGGHDETAQGRIDARLLSNIRESGCAGAVLFAWIDEWFKKNWLVAEFEQPSDRKPLWYNFQDAEENYGLIGYFPGNGGPSILIDGKASDWDKVPVYATSGGYTLKVLADEGWVHLGMFRPAGDTASKGFFVGVDTHDPKRGDHKLPFGLDGSSEAGLEFAILFQGDRAAVFADDRYDLFRNETKRPYKSVSNDDGKFVMPMTMSNRERIGRDGTYYPPHTQEIGWLRRGTQDRASPVFDSLSEWNGSGGFIEARIPWGLLNVTDPSSRSIVSSTEGLKTGSEGTPLTDGMRFIFIAYSGDAFSSKARAVKTIPSVQKGVVPVPPLFTWNTWEEPTWYEVRKKSYAIYGEALSGTPDFPKPK